MKKLYEKHKRKINDLFHIILGFTAMYDIGVATNFYTYTLDGKRFGVTLLSAFLGFAFGVIWEIVRSLKFDKKDVLRTAIAFLVGGLLSTWIAPIQTVWIAFSILSAIILVFNFTYKK